MKAGRPGTVKGKEQPTARKRKPMVARKGERGQDQTLLSDNLRACVAELAYSFYERREYVDGYDLQDWLEAERRILTEES